MKLWHFEITTAITLLLTSLVISAFLGYLFPVLFFVILCVAMYQCFQVSRLERWLRAGGSGKIPKARGVWEEVYFHIYRIKKSDKRRKKRLSAMVKQFRTSTAALPDAAVVLGEHDEIEWANKMARQVLGLKKGDKGQRIPNLIRNPEFIHYLKHKEENSTITMQSPVDDEIFLEFRIVKYGAGLRLLLAQDVTKLKKMERMRKDFVANVSHELRTPLTVLKGYLETLQDFDDGQSSLHSSSFTEMLSQTERMEHLVDDLLMLARLETQPKKPQCVRIDELLDRVCREADILKGSEGRIQLHLDTDVCIFGEEQDLRSAFSNLVVNALKYSPEKSPVEVRWYQDDKSLKLDVKDQGEGIAIEHIPRLTERFYRVDVSRSRKLSGTGLGLAIVKHVLARHHARLDITSTIGKGSCFSCVFPIQQRCEENSLNGIELKNSMQGHKLQLMND